MKLVKRLLSTVLCLSLCLSAMVCTSVTAPASAAYFPDIAMGTWYYDAVQYVSDRGFMNGYANGYFGPSDNLQRQDCVIILASIAGANLAPYQGQTGGLSDVNPNGYYAAAVSWAVANGIVSGYDNGEFGVGDRITREQICTIVWRYVGSPTVYDVEETLSPYPDAARVSSFARTPAAWAIQQGVMSGMADGRLAPTSSASRAQIATILMRADENGLLDRPTDDNLTDEEIDLGDIHQGINDGELDVIFNENGDIRSIDGEFIDATVQNTYDAAEVLNASYTLFDESFYADADQVTAQSADTAAAAEENFYRFNASVDGVPVLGSQIILSTDSNGNVTGLHSTFDKDIYNVDTYADISDSEAQEYALGYLMNELGIDSWSNAPTVTSELIVYNANSEESPALVYAVSIHGMDAQVGLYSYTYYIYANDSYCGDICNVIQNAQGYSASVNATDSLGTSRSINVQSETGNYRLYDSARNIETYNGTNAFVTDVLPGPSTTASSPSDFDSAAVSVHANMADTYDYYLNVLGRDSYDGHGRKICSSYNVGPGFDNAGWIDELDQFCFGDGHNFEAALDVVAHEYTHAVISYVVRDQSANGLIYDNESGGLNEAYADVMGMLVEGKTDSGQWLLGEDCSYEYPRNMSNPTAAGQIAHYSNYDDSLDVHYTSGIFNHAVYKMMTDRRMSSVSNETWASIFYRSLYRLETDATFLDARGAVVASAKAHGFDHDKQQAIKDAFDAVGVTEPESVRFVLTWGDEPMDLDSHLVGPGVNSSGRFHVWYGDRSYYKDGSYYSDEEQYAADLDYDDTTSFGPEVTTIHVLTPGTYYFYVHDYTNRSSTGSTALARSGAAVSVYKGNTLIKTFVVNGRSTGKYWNVCAITIDEDGDIAISPINTYSESESYT